MPDRMRVMDWAEITLTSRCNQRCFFCYEESRDVAADPPLEEVQRILRETRKRADQAVLCGKEVLLRPDVLEIVNYGHKLGLRVVVFSNGQAFAKPGLVEQLAQAGCDSVVVSFHFPDAESFELGARTKRSGFARQMQGLSALRAYNDAHPQHPLHVSTETDMFVMNSGRLAEMRQVLIDHLGTSNWSMRLGSLLPSKVYDIGLPTLLEPMEARRRELAEFFATHPASIPLNVVKSPLCLIPAEHRHLSLELGYLSQGAELTFNHETQGAVTMDTMSVSATRDVQRHLREFPYRWVCRHCALVKVCRFERTSWLFAGFEASAAQKPFPVTEAEAEGLGMGGKGGSPSAAPGGALTGPPPGQAAPGHPPGDLGGDGGGGFPEERVVAGLGVVDAWSMERPGIGVAMQVGQHRVELGLYMPVSGGEQALSGFLCGYLEVCPINASQVPESAWLEAMRTVAEVPLPELADWTGTPLVDHGAGVNRLRAWRLLGQALWPGLGRLGEWRTTQTLSGPDGQIQVSLTHPSGAWVQTWVGRDDIRVVLHEAKLAALAGAYNELLRAVGGGLAGLPTLGSDAEGNRIYLTLREGSWYRTDSRGGTPEPAGSEEQRAARLEDAVAGKSQGVKWAPSGGQLRFAVTFLGMAEPLRFGVAAWSPGSAYLQRVGDRVLWFKGRQETPQSKMVVRILVAVMQHLAQVPLEAGNVGRWLEAVNQVLDRNNLRDKIQVQVYWDE